MSARIPPEPLLRVCDLSVEYPGPRRGLRGTPPVRVVDEVSFEVPTGRTFGLVGESGSGKSTIARAILRLVPARGRVFYGATDLLKRSPRQLHRFRREIQLVFQDPVASLNPRLSVEAIVGEALSVHRLVRTRAERRARVAELLQQVGLSAEDMFRAPGAFSGGQRQRIGIARALALQPQLLICDEPVSALDVSIQSQILNLLTDLQQQHQLTYLFIAHDLAVVRHFCDEIGVLYQGRIVERAPTDQLFTSPRHPYTRLLLDSAPRLRRPGEGTRSIPGAAERHG